MKKVLVIVAIVVLLVVAALSILGTVKDDAAYVQTGESYEEIAREQLDVGGYGSALDYANAALDVGDTIERHQLVAEIYQKSGQIDSYIEELENIIALYPQDRQAYKDLANYYNEQMSYNSVISTLNSAYQADVMDDEMWDLYYGAAFSFRIVSVSFEEAYPFYSDYALVKTEALAGFVDTSMKSYFGLFEDASPLIGDAVAAGKTEDEGWGYYKEEGLCYMNSQDEYMNAQSFSCNRALVQMEDGWYFLNTYAKKVLGPYEDACSFYEDVAAVCEDGKWYLINRSGSKLIETGFNKILISEDNICSGGGVVFADSGKGYDMYSTEGELIKETGFADARLFCIGSLTAVKSGNKWGFVDKTGEFKIEPKFADAQTFGEGIAAVCNDEGLWGFITSSERLVIDYQFEDAKFFGTQALAPVKTENGWVYIKINA